VSLPEKGWSGYGRSGVPSPDLRQAARIRALSISHDNDLGHALREIAFENLRESTVYPAAVNRLIEEAGR
jgi:hypothetical protein